MVTRVKLQTDHAEQRKSSGGPLGERDGDEDVFININGVLRSLTDEQERVGVGADKAITEARVPTAKHELVRSLAIGFDVD